MSDLAFADDTLLIGTMSGHVAEFLAAVSKSGHQYGLELHYGKLQLLQVGSIGAIRTPSGQVLEAGQEMTYLGTIIAERGDVSRELNRRIGLAKADFISLSKLWRHSALSRTKKLSFFASLI